MTDTTQIPPAVPPADEKKPGWQSTFWQSLDAVKAIACTVVVAWVATIFVNIENSTLTNVIMIIIGYFFGSSSGSKAKDALRSPEKPKEGPAP